MTTSSTCASTRSRPRVIARRLAANKGLLPRFLNLVRAVSSEGFGRVRYDENIRGLLDSDRSVRRFFEGETTDVPAFYVDRVRRDLGPLFEWLPTGALDHDPNAYLKSQAAATATTVEAPREPGPRSAPASA